MKRRGVLLGAAVPWLPTALAQVPSRPARIAMPLAMPYAAWPRRAAFIDAMRERGWIEGSHFVVDVVQADGSAQGMPAAAAELVQRRPDLIVTSGTSSVGPIMKATSTIPIVFYGVGDPVGSGLVASLGVRAATSPASAGWRSERTPSSSICCPRRCRAAGASACC